MYTDLNGRVLSVLIVEDQKVLHVGTGSFNLFKLDFFGDGQIVELFGGLELHLECPRPFGHLGSRRAQELGKFVGLRWAVAHTRAAESIRITVETMQQTLEHACQTSYI